MPCADGLHDLSCYHNIRRQEVLGASFCGLDGGLDLQVVLALDSADALGSSCAVGRHIVRIKLHEVVEGVLTDKSRVDSVLVEVLKERPDLLGNALELRMRFLVLFDDGFALLGGDYGLNAVFVRRSENGLVFERNESFCRFLKLGSLLLQSLGFSFRICQLLAESALGFHVLFRPSESLDLLLKLLDALIKPFERRDLLLEVAKTGLLLCHRALFERHTAHVVVVEEVVEEVSLDLLALTSDRSENLLQSLSLIGLGVSTDAVLVASYHFLSLIPARASRLNESLDVSDTVLLSHSLDACLRVGEGYLSGSPAREDLVLCRWFVLRVDLGHNRASGLRERVADVGVLGWSLVGRSFRLARFEGNILSRVAVLGINDSVIAKV